jgi:hypothetical protein
MIKKIKEKKTSYFDNILVKLNQDIQFVFDHIYLLRNIV